MGQEVAPRWETKLAFINIVKVRKAIYKFARFGLLNIASYTHYEIVFLNLSHFGNNCRLEQTHLISAKLCFFIHISSIVRMDTTATVSNVSDGLGEQSPVEEFGHNFHDSSRDAVSLLRLWEMALITVT